jgi:hypothetical protein
VNDGDLDGLASTQQANLLAQGEKLLPRIDPDCNEIDLADTFLDFWPYRQRTVEMRLSSESKKWLKWDEKALALMEENIRYDLSHDGYRVIIKRISGVGEPCSTEMRWKLIVRPVRD